MRELRAYAWAQFAAAALTFTRQPLRAAIEADKLQEEFDKRFGPCPDCKGEWNAVDICKRCHGTGAKI